MRIGKYLTLLLVALTSCATLYQQEGLFSNGYSDLQSGQNTFVITFRASEHTPAKKVKKYALKRAGEVTLKHNYRYFVILDETGKGKNLHYPSIRLTIQCFHEPPPGIEVIDARSIH